MEMKSCFIPQPYEIPDCSLFFSAQNVLKVGLPGRAWGLGLGKVKDSSSHVLGNSLAELMVLPGKCALQIGSVLSRLLILHQIIKLDPTNQSRLSLDRRAWCVISSLPGSLMLWKLSSLLAVIETSCYPRCFSFRKCINASMRVRKHRSEVWGRPASGTLISVPLDSQRGLAKASTKEP